MSMDLSRRVGLFGTASFISPLIGLMGTVLGIMRAFHDLAAAGAGGPAVVAAGISEALVTTATGIGVAVMSAVLYNYFTLSVRHRLNTADLWVFELASILSQLKALQKK
jgi:biopolymer transport protein ExbB